MKKLLFNIKKVLAYTFIAILVSSLTGGSLYVGYKKGKKDNIKEFHALLIEKGFAHYNETSGSWEFKKSETILTPISDVLNTGIIFYNDDIMHSVSNKKIAKK